MAAMDLGKVTVRVVPEVADEDLDILVAAVVARIAHSPAALNTLTTAIEAQRKRQARRG